MKLYTPEKILIDPDAENYPLTQKILNRLPGVPVERITDSHALRARILKTSDPIGRGKRYLYLTHDKGRSFKPFPESHQYLSCDYFTLHIAEGCDLECSYCILQAYLTNPWLTVYVNVEEMLAGLEATLRQNPDRFFRIGTGQLADSLSLDHLTGMSEILVSFFARQPNAVLELKTKSNNISRLLNLDSGGRTIVSWSVNSRRIQTEEEHKCATLEERIEAAAQISRHERFRTAFHFDPVIDYPGWENEYREVIEMVLAKIPHERIAWMSFGCLRFVPEMKKIMENRFPKSGLPTTEWITGMDGKLRYFKPRRIEIYRTLIAIVRELAPSVTVYLSMETPEVWEKALGKRQSKKSVCALLDGAGKSTV